MVLLTKVILRELNLIHSSDNESLKFTIVCFSSFQGCVQDSMNTNRDHSHQQSVALQLLTDHWLALFEALN